ncbi:hypothetical protein KV100_07415 [Mumia sp. zg.B21]|uniref:hypothetical protein n=1 Tax=Mumia sp. zg.B21 TaxID=2855447 RepID=UPI001C6EA6DA|nr:hypothetical protein [Mumia sp. zg.B21]MBW9209480.1 hypothetical protein [Mumia sp. zg.B21]
MSSVMRPSGKLPPGVYWRRRLVVLTAVLLLGWLALRVIGGGDDQKAGGEPPATSTSVARTEPSATTAPTRAHKPRKAKDVAVDVRLAAVDGVCPPETVFVTPSVVEGARAGGTVPVTLRVSSTATKPCTVRIDPSTFVLSVKSKDTTVWDTQACGEIQGRTVDVHPTWATVIDVTWDGRANADTCDEEGAFAKPAPYSAYAAILGGEPAVARFTLVAPPTPTPTPAPTTSPAAKPAPNPGATPATPPKPGSAPATSRTP